MKKQLSISIVVFMLCFTTAIAQNNKPTPTPKPVRTYDGGGKTYMKTNSSSHKQLNDVMRDDDNNFKPAPTPTPTPTPMPAKTTPQ